MPDSSWRLLSGAKKEMWAMHTDDLTIETLCQQQCTAFYDCWQWAEHTA
jgi:hypothetical protein